MNLEQARFNMIEQQIRPWDVLDQRILDVLAATPRDAYVPEAYHALAYSDTRIPLGHGQTMMNPNVEGRLLQALQLKPTDKVLEIGTGSGYVTACLAKLANEVDSIEYYADLASSAQQKLVAHGLKNVCVTNADAAQGWGGAYSYDAIAITGSTPVIPAGFKQALKIGGRLFVIEGSTRQPIMTARRFTRMSEHDYMQEALFETSIAPLINVATPTPFIF